MHGGCQSESEADGMVEPWMRRSHGYTIEYAVTAKDNKQCNIYLQLFRSVSNRYSSYLLLSSFDHLFLDLDEMTREEA
jgi:hypothetical protein